MGLANKLGPPKKVTVPDKSVAHAAPRSIKGGSKSDEYIQTYVIAQYTEMHESKRQWEKFIWQAPVISTTLVGILFAVLAGNQVPILCGNLPLAFAFGVLGFFSFVIGYWGHRSRILLRQVEHELNEIEKEHFVYSYAKYPREVNASLTRRFDKLSSTRLIVSFMWVITAAMLGGAVMEVAISLEGQVCRGQSFYSLKALASYLGFSSVLDATP